MFCERFFEGKLPCPRKGFAFHSCALTFWNSLSQSVSMFKGYYILLLCFGVNCNESSRAYVLLYEGGWWYPSLNIGAPEQPCKCRIGSRNSNSKQLLKELTEQAKNGTEIQVARICRYHQEPFGAQCVYNTQGAVPSQLHEPCQGPVYFLEVCSVIVWMKGW